MMGFIEDMELHLERHGYQYSRVYGENGLQKGWAFTGGYRIIRYPDFGWSLTQNGAHSIRLNDGFNASELIRQLNCFDYVLKASLPPVLPLKVEEPLEDRPAEECAVCLEKIPERVAIVPCGHTTVCKDCCSELESCPLCRTKIDKVIKLF